jgi:membrane protease YdiL (CAAX protease family)
VYERTGKLWAPILMHALFNAVSIALALFTRG